MALMPPCPCVHGGPTPWVSQLGVCSGGKAWSLSWTVVGTNWPSASSRGQPLYISIQTKPLEPRGELSTKGHTLLGIRATDAAAVEMDIQQVMVYCDASLAIQESCCEIPGARCPPDAPKSRRAAENDLEQPVLAFNQVIHTQISQQADQRHQVLTGRGTLLPKHSIGSPVIHWSSPNNQ
ncbi:unnamed protein product [Oncorhynchus mykiss]|uniref:Uncharacterized protein n=1 Tax=Oncorhynchus mykiss TaxID=8022 RepID=A0A060WY05_ONCMY|nr:unnamed protein product [Oncorhynchus mykiss]